jgi:hypothetical protein
MKKRTHLILCLLTFSWLLFLGPACSDADEGGDQDSIGSPDVIIGTGDVGEKDGAQDTGVVTPGDSGVAGDTAAAVDDTPGPGPTTGPELIVVPESHSFSYISPLAESLFKQITLHNTGSEPLTITAIGFTQDSSVDYDIVLIPPFPKVVPPNKSTLVNVRFQEKQTGPGTLRIESNATNGAVVDVPFTSHVKATIDVPEPCVALEPSQLNFGTVVRGQDKTLSAVLKNCAKVEALELKKITRSGALFFPLSEEFQLVPEPATPSSIAAGQELKVNVRYSPKLAGPDSGYFEFHTNDPTEPAVQLDVFGIGVEPPAEEIGLTIKVSWDADSCDVDSHLLMPGGAFFDCDSDCHFGNPAPDWGTQGDWIDDPFLDIDDVDGYGPEHINISEPKAGKYTFMIHYYDNSYEGFGTTDTNVTVQVLSYGQVIATLGPTYLDTTNRTWDVFELTWVGPNVAPNIVTLGNTYMVPNSAIKACFSFFP